MSPRGRVIRFPGVAGSPDMGPQVAQAKQAMPPSDSPGRAVPPLARDAQSLVEVYHGPQAEAVVVKSFLESEGIPTLLRSRLAQAVYPFSVGHQGEAAVLVPEDEAVRSRRLLLRAWAKARAQ